MMRIRLISSLLFFLLLLALTAYGQAPARVETVNFASKLVGLPLPYHVVLPPDYDAATERATRYPVLYLLHGLAGSHDDCVMATAIAWAARQEVTSASYTGNSPKFLDLLHR